MRKMRVDILRSKAIEWRRAQTIVTVDKPTRIDLARRLGYKDKQGYVVARIRIGRGTYRRKRPRSGRRPKHLGVVRIKKGPGGQRIAENRVAQRYPNLHVLSSYLLHRDTLNSYYEVIMVDPHHPSIRADSDMKVQLPDRTRRTES
jgi:large subunit ribosomal protein L15e